MESLFIKYDQALALKELGFDEPCLAIFTNRYTNGETYPKAVGQHEGSNISGDKNSDFDGQSFWYVTAPTFSQAFRWFREKYQLYAWVKIEYEYGGITPTYYITGKRQGDIAGGAFKTYEEAEQECLIKLIEIVKEKK
jgi:hypothetical protein